MKPLSPKSAAAFSVFTNGTRLKRFPTLLLTSIAIFGALRFWTSAVAAELPAKAPAPGSRFIGEAHMAYSASAISPEVGEISGQEVAIQADILFCNSSAQPSGTLCAIFRGADMVMKASTLDWLVVSPKQVEMKGPCVLDDADGFTFQMKVEQAADTGKRHIRLKVWETAKPSHVVFDNQRDDSWSAPFKAAGELLSGDLRVS